MGKRFFKSLAYKFFHCLFKIILKTFYRFKVFGVENIPQEGPIILAANHTSFLDPPVIGVAMPRPVHFMARHTLFDRKSLRWFMNLCNAFPVRQGGFSPEAFRYTMKLLAAGEVVLLFPEGTRSRDGRLGQGKRGVALIALRSGAPVVPVAVKGTFRSLPTGARFPKPTPITVKFGKPMRFEDKGEGKAVFDEITGRIMDAIRELLEDED